ncbi:MAG: hypothetical protein ACPG77_14640, partial [Nannocystaceae bacterium]
GPNAQVLGGGGGGGTQLSMGNDAWAIGEDRPQSGLGGGKSSGGKGGIIAVLLLLVIAGAGAAFWMMKGSDNVEAPAVASAGDSAVVSPPGPGDEKANDSEAKKAGDSEAKAADTGPKDTGGETTTAGGSASTSASDSDGDSEGKDTSSDSGGDSKSGTTKKKKVRPDTSLVAKSGSLYTHKKPGATGTLAAAKSYCSKLKRAKHAKLSRWRLATLGEVLKFRGKPEIKKYLYWTSSKASAGKGKAVIMVTGKPTERPADDKRGRPFCVAKS